MKLVGNQSCRDSIPIDSYRFLSIPLESVSSLENAVSGEQVAVKKVQRPSLKALIILKLSFVKVVEGR